MATIKSYTDISQSKKLAEILPIESADMHYNNGPCRGVDYTEPFSAELMPYQEALQLMKIHKTNFMFRVIPCWSLAALLSVLPQGTRLLKSGIDDAYHCDCPKGNIDKWFDNPIDACVGIILKLHELNLL